uniref:GEVED domain-containing protein n=1 Tax=Aequorivita capsosiphonis TaxID=487317 RepID=UPI001FDF5085
MKRSTIIGCFVGLLSLTLSAQTTQPSDSRASSSPTDIGVQKSTVTIQDLLARYNNVGKQAGSVSEHFTIEEQRMLRAYFSNQQPARAANAANTVVFNSSVEAKNIAFTQEQRAAYNRTPLFVAPRALTAEDEAELLAAGQNRLNTNVANNTVIQSRILSDIVPTAGEVETFNPAVGDNFFDPGGPGGENTDGAPGNYPNCNCDTQTTLAGVTEIEFLEFGVNGYFDYLKIYDGADATGTLLYDNSQTGANNGDKVLADMIASNGSATFTSTSGDLFFFFHASGVVNWLGWDVEIVAAGGGGGSGYCTPEGTNSDRFIDNFSTTGGSENISNMGSGFSAGGYGDFYDTATVTQEQEGNVDFSADMEGGTAGFRIWVDWNQDGVFDTTDEVAYASSGYLSNQTGTITVPADALEGDTRMRVVSHWLSTTGDVDPCETGFTYGEFEDYKFTVTSGGGGTFPEPYCGPLTFNNGVEPITLVDVAGISNVSDATLDGSPAHEDFTAIEGDMEEGMTYAIALEGNTGGGFTNSFTVFIDWNQDGILDNDSERYEIGTIVGSTGTDGQQATGDIVVPSGVTAGQTRMRVIKRFPASYATDSCTPGSGYGQAEDYTINVTGGGGTGGDCEQEHPIAGDGNGGSGSSVDSDFTSAADIVVAAGEDFTLDTIEVSFLTFAPEDAPITANVI